MLMKDRKQIMIRVRKEIARQYERKAQQEGFAVMNAWIISVLNERAEVNKMLARSQHQERSQSHA